MQNILGSLSMVDKVIYVLQRYFQIKKTFPKIDWMVQKLRIPNTKLIELLRALEILGFVDRNYNQYKVTQKLIDYNVGAGVLVEEKKKEIDQSIFDTDEIQITIIRIIMAVVGVGAVIMSCYFSIRWLLEYLSVFWAYILGIIMVLFSAFGFESVIIFRKNKQYKTIR